MTPVVGFVVGVLTVRLLVVAGQELLRTPALLRPNLRGKSVPTAIGLLAVLAVVFVEGGRELFGVLGVGDSRTDLPRTLVLLVCVGFGLLGLIDDVAGTASDHGFRGHLGALAHGRVTTGVVKIVGGAALALVVVGAGRDPGSSGRVIADAALVALAANLANLFDCAPGRALKIGLLAWLPIALLARTNSIGVAIAPAMGAFAGLLGDDLHERLMLGDAGANAMGAVIGLAVVFQCAPTTRTIVLAVVAAFTIAGELVSFSRVIDRVPVLRKLDELGRGA